MAQNQTDNPPPLALSLQPTHHIPLPTRLFHSFASTSFDSSASDQLTLKNIPIFNHDQQHFTPTFTLGIDQVPFLLCSITIRLIGNSKNKSLQIKFEGSLRKSPIMYLHNHLRISIRLIHHQISVKFAKTPSTTISNTFSHLLTKRPSNNPRPISSYETSVTPSEKHIPLPKGIRKEGELRRGGG